MLVMFRFKNYGPFRDEAVLDMRAIKSYKEHPYNLITKCTSIDPLLKVVAIYGANASGKTNFVDAYFTFASIVRYSFQKNNKDDGTDPVLSQYFFPFLLDNNDKEPIEFEAVYQYADYEYKYGFVYNEEQIEYEWLYRTSLKSKRQSRILERSADSMVLGASIKNACEKYISDIDSDVLALSFFSSLKLRTHAFTDTISCITDFLPVSPSLAGHTGFMNKYFERDFDEVEKPKLLSFLNAIDVGIKDIVVEKNNKDLRVYTYHAGKNNIRCRFPIELESAGTLRAIEIYSLVRIAVQYGKGLIIDEFNNQLHPLLQKYIIDLFYDENACGQLIYTTHDTTLLDRQFIRRDQVWFISKNEDGESSMYSLAEFKVRNDKSFGKDYLGGVYGGIPILKDFSFKED